MSAIPQKDKGILLLLAVMLVALNLRPSMATIGPLLPYIQQDISLSFGMASLLTMLPVLAIGGATFFSSRLAQTWSPHTLILFSLALIGSANALRWEWFSASGLIATALMAGIGIAIIQVMMPPLLKQRFPERISTFMGFYVTAIMAGAALSAASAPFIVTWTESWQFALAVWVFLALVSMFVWFKFKSALSGAQNQSATIKLRQFAANPRAWVLALFFGLATSAFTCVLAWLAPYYIELGWEEESAGLLIGYLTAMEVVSGIVSPMLAEKSKDRRKVLFVLVTLTFIGMLGLASIPLTLPLLWPALLGLGIGGLFPMSLILAMDHIKAPAKAGQLTAFVQGVGYAIAAFSPLLAGYLRDVTGSFEISWWGLASVCLLLAFFATRFNPEQYQTIFPSQE